MSNSEQDQAQEVMLPIEWHVSESVQNRYAHTINYNAAQSSEERKINR